MGRIDKSHGQDSTMERRHIHAMLRNIDEYEQVKAKKHPTFKTAQDFYDTRKLCKQNFLKYYRRYLLCHRDIHSLIPHKSGRKFKDSIQYNPEVLEKVQTIRSKGYNRFDISLILKQQNEVDISPS